MNRRWILALSLGGALVGASVVQADDEERKDDANARRPAADAPERQRDDGPRRGPPEGREGARRGDEERREAGRHEGDAHGRRARPDDGERGARRAPPPPREEGEPRDPQPRGGLRPGQVLNLRDVRDADHDMRQRGMMDRHGDMERLKQDDPEMFALAKADMEMEQQTRQLVDQYHRVANDADREQLRGKLTAVVENHFAVRQQRRELEVKRLEAQLQRLRDSLKKRGDERQKIVAQHLSQLLGNDDEGF